TDIRVIPRVGERRSHHCGSRRSERLRHRRESGVQLLESSRLLGSYVRDRSPAPSLREHQPAENQRRKCACEDTSEHRTLRCLRSIARIDLISEAKSELNSSRSGNSSRTQSLAGADGVERLSEERRDQCSGRIRKVDVIEDIRRGNGQTNVVPMSGAPTDLSKAATARSAAETAP